MTSFSKRDSQFSKFDDEHRIAYGWAIVSQENGKPYFDLQGDHIPMTAVVAASIDFMKNSRASDDMHLETKTGEIVFCAPVVKGQLVDPTHPEREGLWIGAQIHDEAVYQKTKKGERAGFSIGGFLDEADYVATNGELYQRSAKGAQLRLIDNDFLAKRERTAKGKKPQRIFRSFRLNFISTVDLPAQEGALISVVKNAPAETLLWIRKGVVLTSEEDGHQHVIDPTCFDEKGRGYTSSAQTAGKEYGYHSHDLVRMDDGTIVIASNAGHGHTIDAKAEDAPTTSNDTATVELIAARKPEFLDEEDDEDEDDDDKKKKKPKAPLFGASEKKNNKALAQANASALGCRNTEENATMAKIEIEQTEYDALKKSASIAKRSAQVSELTDAQKTYFGKLSEAGQDSFLAKSAVERGTELTAQIEYTSPITGDVFYKFDDARVISATKRADAAEQRSTQDSMVAKRAGFAKRAGEIMKGYPGEDNVHTEIVGAVETFITDPALQKSAIEAITAGSVALLSKTAGGGHNGQVGKGAGPANDDQPIEKKRTELTLAVTEYQKAKGLDSYEVAYLQATGSDPKVRALYEEIAELSE